MGLLYEFGRGFLNGLERGLSTNDIIEKCGTQTNRHIHKGVLKVSLQLRMTSRSNGQAMYSTEGNFPSKDVFHQRLYSIKGGVPSDVISH